MNKQEQLKEYITQDIVSFLVEDNNINMPDALHHFYTSDTYDKLMDSETGLYLEGSAYIYSLLLDEQNGVIVQKEI